MALRTGVLLLGDHPPARLISLASLAEELGYAYLWYADERFYREVYSGLTMCALHTSRIHLGPCVTDPYSRHPALTAMAIATLDEASHGRAVLGLGAGISGFRELGIARERPALAIRETVEVVNRLLQGESVTFRGELVQLHGARLNFVPPRPHIPIYVASNAPRGLETAGRVADGAIMQGCVAEVALRYFRRQVVQGTMAAGRKIEQLDLVARINVCIHDVPQVARDLMRRSVAVSLIAQQPDFPGFVAAGLDVPPALRERVRNLTYGYGGEAAAAVASEIPDAFVDALTLAGTVEQVAVGVARMVRKGVTQVAIYPMAPDQNIERVIKRFAVEVLPAVKELKVAPQ